MRFYWPIAKVDQEQRMVWGYASTDAEDDQGETVTRAALAAALDDYMKFANIREMHRNSAVGIAREATIDDRGLYLGAKIVDDDAWRKVVEGVYKGFSIGGRVTARAPADRKTITGLALTEISVVDRPANPEAVFDCWKRAAAADDASLVRPSVGRTQSAEAALDPHDKIDHADPGYQPDAKPRYPLDTVRHIRAAWAYIHQGRNARRYTPGQLAQLKARIVAAWQARIDPAGPPEAAAAHRRAPGDAAPVGVHKGLVELGRLAQLRCELDWLSDRVALDAAVNGDAAPVDLQDALDELCDFIESQLADAAADLAAEADAADLAAVARAGGLRKARLAHADGLVKFAGEVMPRLQALQERVEAIARTPLPPQAAARGFTGLMKHEDGWAAAPSDSDIVAALARMSDDERTLVLIKAAHATPITSSAGYRR